MGIFSRKNNDNDCYDLLNKLYKIGLKISLDLNDIYDLLEDVHDEVSHIRFQLSSPGKLKLLLKEQVMDKILFKVTLPTLTDVSVATRELSVKIGDAEAVVTTVAKDAVEVDGLSGPQDSAVEVSLVDVDEAGNRSKASVLNAVLTDVFPPAQPGELALVQTAEVVEEVTPV